MASVSISVTGIGGNGYLAGESPYSITSVLDNPVQAKIKILFTDSQGNMAKVYETLSATDGSWIVDGLSTDLQFDVICEYPGYNDLIFSKVTPATITSPLWKPDNLDVPPSIILDTDSTVVEESGAVSQWVDRSANSFVFSQSASGSRPVKVVTDGEIPCIRFDGVNDALTNNTTQARGLLNGASSVWAFAVISKRGLDSTDTSRLILGFSGESGGLERFSLRAGYTDSGMKNKFCVAARRVNSDSYNIVPSPSELGNGFRMLAATIDYSTGECKSYVDGDMVISTTLTSAGAASNSTGSQAVAIGRHPDNTSSAADIDVACLLLGVNKVLNDAELDRIFGWAAKEYHLRGNLREDHPYKTKAPYL